MRKKILEKRLNRLNSKRQSLTERAMSSQDVNEVRSINAELEDVNAEIAETQEELDAETAAYLRSVAERVVLQGEKWSEK